MCRACQGWNQLFTFTQTYGKQTFPEKTYGDIDRNNMSDIYRRNDIEWNTRSGW